MQKTYKIAVEIAALNSAGPVLALLSKDLLGLGNQAKYVTRQMGALKVAAGGAIAAMGGAAILGGAYALAKYGDQVVQAQNRLLAAGATAKSVAAATKAAFNVATTTPGTTPSGNIDLINELRPALGGKTAEAISVLPGIAKDLIALNMSGMKGFSGQAGVMVKALDLMGAGMKNGKFDPAQFAQAFNELTQVEFATGGLLTPTTLLRIAQTGGFTAQGYSFTQWLQMNLPALLEMGSRAGTGMSATAMQLYGGSASVKTVRGLKEYGLVNPNGVVDDHGQYTIKPGALYGYSDLMHKGIAYWIQHDLVAKLKSEGINSTAGMIAALTSIFGSVRAARYVMTMATPAGQVMSARDYQLAAKAFNTGPYALEMDSLNSQTTALGTSFTTLLQTLGGPLVLPAINAVAALNTAVLGLSAWAKIHPERVKLIVEGIAGLGAAMLVFGSVAVIGAMISLGGAPALIAGAVAAVGIAVAGLILNFGKIKPGFEAFEKDIQTFVWGLFHPFSKGSWMDPGSVSPQLGGRQFRGHAISNPSNPFDDAWNAVSGWVSAGAPVTVTNPQHIGKAIVKGVAGKIAQHQGGTNGFNGNSMPMGSAGAGAN